MEDRTAAIASHIKQDLQGDPLVGFVLEQMLLPREPRGYTPPTDPEWSNQWTLVKSPNHILCIFTVEYVCGLHACTV